MNRVKRIARQRRLTQTLLAATKTPTADQLKKHNQAAETHLIIQAATNKGSAFYPSRNNYLQAKRKAEMRAAILGEVR